MERPNVQRFKALTRVAIRFGWQCVRKNAIATLGGLRGQAPPEKI